MFANDTVCGVAQTQQDEDIHMWTDEACALVGRTGFTSLTVALSFWYAQQLYGC